MSVFFAPELRKGQQHFQLNEDESKHCIKVLRMQVGAEIRLINGKGLEAICQIQDAQPKRVVLSILESIEHPQTHELHIAMAPTKNMDRIEWFLEKATEMGLSKLTFLQCEHNERKAVNMERLQKIAVAAMKQSKRYYLPELENLMGFQDFISAHPNGYFGHCNAGEKIKLSAIENSAVFLIGPEGDFSYKEIQLADKSGYKAVDMSAFRLRTETAALLAVANFARINL
jgi:16S rRNA (uracil1498-N3)-methyltransferase